MNKVRVMSLLVGLVSVLIPLEASAQFGGFGGQFGQPINPSGRPRVSPFINLGRGGSAALNFFGIVRPQVQAANAIRGLELNQQLGGLNSQTGGGRSYFFNYSHYYPGLQQGGGGAGGIAGSGVGTPIGNPGILGPFNSLGGRPTSSQLFR